MTFITLVKSYYKDNFKQLALCGLYYINYLVRLYCAIVFSARSLLNSFVQMLFINCFVSLYYI